MGRQVKTKLLESSNQRRDNLRPRWTATVTRWRGQPAELEARQYLFKGWVWETLGSGSGLISFMGRVDFVSFVIRAFEAHSSI